MKKVGLMILFMANSVIAQQPTATDFKAEDMVLIPAGTLAVSAEKINVNSFWMSNEISNKEYCQFTDYVIKHMSDTLFFSDAVEDGGKVDSSLQKFVIYKDIATGLLDTLAMAHVYSTDKEKFKLYRNYFTDKKFDNYPVVGVTQRSATYFCMWKNMLYQEATKKDKVRYRINYRLPTLTEWNYAAMLAEDSEPKAKSEVIEVKGLKANKIGLFNLFGNVSEWTSTTGSKPILKVVKGASWKTNEPKDYKFILGQDLKASHVGFRIILVNLGPIKSE